MSPRLDRVEHPGDLPAGWDELATEYYQRREFLCHCQTFNPCHQRYYILRGNDDLLAGAIVYTLRFDLLTYLGIKSPTTIHVVGIPASVSSSGVVGDPGLFGDFFKRILAQEPGLIACLNLDCAPAGSPMFVGRTWPGIVLTNTFPSWEDYLGGLRSAYRRRACQIMEDMQDFEIRRLSCKAFTGEMHSLYLEVRRRSEGKLEQLTCAFFRNLPESFCLSTYAAAGRLCGWTITRRDGDRFSFFLGGQDYSYKPDRVYLVKIMDVVRMGVESGARWIDLGQSAEVPKMRLGGKPHEKIMLAYHHRMIPRAMLRVGMGVLSYHKHFPDAHVFKGGNL